MITVYPNGTKSLMIQWGDVDGDEFTLYRSTSPEGEFEMISINQTTPFYEDEDVNLFENGRRYYYKVEGYVGGRKVIETKPVQAMYNRRDGVANVVIYESRVVLRVMNNPPVKVLLKKRGNKKCPKCWNPVTKKVKFSDCEFCHGTGMWEGYHNPIEIRISRDFSQLINNPTILDSEKVEKTRVNAWVSNYPLLSPGDVIVDIMNERFFVERVTQRTRSQYIIRQVLDLVPLEKGHPSYSVDVDWSDYIG